KDRDIDVISAFEAVGQYEKGKIDGEELYQLECSACPGPGACGGMYTANTMAAAAEALGMSMPGSSSTPAVDKNKEKESKEAGEQIYHLLENAIYPKDIMTKKAFENAIAIGIALGGSTNLYLHLLAISQSLGVDLSYDDFERIRKQVPV